MAVKKSEASEWYHPIAENFVWICKHFQHLTCLH